MTSRESQSPTPQVFAQKGSAQPASGLRSVYPDVARPQAPPADPHAESPRAEEDNELAEAASLDVSGFSTPRREMPAQPAPVVAAPEPDEAAADQLQTNPAPAGPAGIDTALAEAGSAPHTASRWQRAVFAGSGDISRSLIVAALFAALLLISLGIGYGISVLAQTAASDDGGPAPAATAATAPPRPGDTH